MDPFLVILDISKLLKLTEVFFELIDFLADFFFFDWLLLGVVDVLVLLVEEIDFLSTTIDFLLIVTGFLVYFLATILPFGYYEIGSVSFYLVVFFFFKVFPP